MSDKQQKVKELENKMFEIYEQNQGGYADRDDLIDAGYIAEQALKIAGPEFAGIANLFSNILLD